MIEEDEAERKKKKKMAELEHKAELEKQMRLRAAEMEAEKIRLSSSIRTSTIETTTEPVVSYSQYDLSTFDEDLLGISEEELDK